MIDLALHTLRVGTGRALLLLHGLGEHTPATTPDWAEGWSGPVRGLDFTGHGRSSVPFGGGYSVEVLMGDVDIALAEIGEATVVGRGLGAYVALLIAGARPTLVRGAVLLDGPGLAGGSTTASSSSILWASPPPRDATPDPWALAELAHDVRPPDYATAFVRAAHQLSGLDTPIAVCTRWRPPWLRAVADEVGVYQGTLEDALALYLP